MNKKYKKLWIKALRSGDYLQTRGMMKSDEGDNTSDTPGKPGYCCLGVLKDIRRKEQKKSWAACENGVNADGQLSTKELEKFGLRYDEQSDLIQLNDLKKKSFEYISEYIEKNL